MEVKKALTFRASSIGDCLMGKYLLDNIHAQYPGARLGLVVGSRGAMMRDLLADYPYIEVVEVHRRNPASLWRLWRGWRGSDMVVTQYAGKPGGRFSLASKFVARLLSKKLVGFTDAARMLNKFLYDMLVPFDPAEAPAEMERRALRAAGLATPVPYPSLVRPTQPVREHFGLSRYVTANLFSGGLNRSLAPARRRALVVALRAVLPRGVELILVGGPQDRAAAADAAGSDARSLAGQLTLRDTIALVAESVCTVSLDTGVGHIAAQLGTPAIILASCLGVQWWGVGQYGASTPAKLFCKKCLHHKRGQYPPCLNDIDMGEVARAVLLKLSQR